MITLDKFKGCLIGGAVGDALGYAVEFLSESSIFARYGSSGITDYKLYNGLGRISDDTQMTLFTANGLLLGYIKEYNETCTGTDPEKSCIPYLNGISRAYLEWHKTQVQYFERVNKKLISCWLSNVPELYEDRAPGTTCMSAIEMGCCGTIESPINNSKGCGGVMRVAPIGLYFGPKWSDQEVDLLGARAAALTHGHELGYIPAALLVHILRFIIQNECKHLKDAVMDGISEMEQLFSGSEYMQDFSKLIRKAIMLSEGDQKDIDAIHALGQGWVGDEALAIAIYCALKYENNFEKAIVASVNHNGDSDSTGAITGNILGAHLGFDGIPQKYIDKLELRDVIFEISEDLHKARTCIDYELVNDIAWEKKYVDCTYAPASNIL